MGRFLDLVRRGRIPAPSSRTYSPDGWKAEYKKHRQDDADDRLFGAGEWLFTQLSAIRDLLKHAPELVCPAPTKIRAYVGFCNWQIAAVRLRMEERQENVGQAIDDARAKGIEQYAVLKPDRASSDIVEATVDALRFPLARIGRGEALQGSRIKRTHPDAAASVRADLQMAHFYDAYERLWQSFLWMDWEVVDSGTHVTVKPHDGAHAIDHTISVARRDHILAEITAWSVIKWSTHPEWIKKLFTSQRQIREIERRGKRKYLRVDAFDAYPELPPTDHTNGVAAEELYFNPLLTWPLSALGEITIREMLACWGVLAPLARLCEERFPPLGEVAALNTLLGYAQTFTRRELIDALRGARGLTEEIAGLVIDKLTFDGTVRDDLWRRPFVATGDGDDLCFVTSALAAPNLIRSIEEWLRESGVDLAERGVLFENYVRDELKEGNTIPDLRVSDKSDFDCGADREEIDLALTFGHTILLGEEKCSTQPVTSRDVHNHYRDLEGGCRQMRRKLDTVKKNLPAFLASAGWTDLDPATVRVLGVVISNLPIGAGTSHHDIPVVDHLIFNKYFSEPWIQSGVFQTPDGKPANLEKRRFYDTPTQAEQRLSTYLSLPPQLSTYTAHLGIKHERLPPVAAGAKPAQLVDFSVSLPDVESLMPAAGGAPSVDKT